MDTEGHPFSADGPSAVEETPGTCDFRPVDAASFQFVFRGRALKMDTLRHDLSAAGIVCQDEQGRRVDLHALRVTFGTNLVLSGAHPRVAQELMRHSDIRLTMEIYTDASKLPLAGGVAGLPSFGVNQLDVTYSRNVADPSSLKIVAI